MSVPAFLFIFVITAGELLRGIITIIITKWNFLTNHKFYTDVMPE